MKDYKLLNQKIFERASLRGYTQDKIELLENRADPTLEFGLVPLFKDIKYKILYLKDGDGVKNVKAPYCFGFYTDDVNGALENIGFVGQQLSLELQARGIGSCWWGMKKPDRNHRTAEGLYCVITMGAGLPSGKMTRALTEFDRKPIEEICLKDKDGLLEAVRLAPSAVNRQPWLVEKVGDSYNFYLSKPKSVMDKLFLTAMRRIDMGIAMSHLYVSAKAQGYAVEIKADGRNTGDATYVATLKLSK